MYLAAALAIVATMLLALVRAAQGPTVFDRILAANMIGTKTVLLIAVAGFLTGRPDFLDLALVYALINFIGVVAVCKFTRFRNLADDRTRSSAEANPAVSTRSGEA
ncbi:MAG: monovalent cation/H+ antiporter complex subunit F [Proteobacteria bacterium]|nr:monovalent cation/H+ antiporter complex subunit F [Pseudomonadota bacterium]